jgi:hypothetical protein
LLKKFLSCAIALVCFSRRAATPTFPTAIDLSPVNAERRNPTGTVIVWQHSSQFKLVEPWDSCHTLAGFSAEMQWKSDGCG